jgi:hypothetical protein
MTVYGPFREAGACADTIADFAQTSGDRIHLATVTVSDALAHSMQVNSGGG